jgi:hypothetical protein
MRRRDFIKVIVSLAAAWPGVVWPQQPDRIRRVSLLVGLDENDPETKARIKAFRLGMRDLGWIEGGNIQVEYRFAGSNLELINKHVAELIRQKARPYCREFYSGRGRAPTGDQLHSYCHRDD